MQWVWDFAFKLLPYVAGLVILWTLIGAVAGLALGAVSTVIAFKAGGFRHEWKHAVWFRVLGIVMIVGGFAVLGAAIGAWEGALAGFDEALREGPFRSEVLLRAGKAGAWGLAKIDVSLGAQADCEAFQRGELEWNVVKMLNRLEKAEDRVVEEATKKAKTELRTRWDIPENPWIESILDVILASLVRKAVREKVGGALSDQGVDVSPLFTKMPELAKAKGNPETATFDELSNHVVDCAVVPILAGPSKGFVRGQQLVLAFGFPIVLLIPLLGFWIGRIISRRRAGPAAP